MIWHGSCYACTCTNNHPQPSFARLSPRAAAIGRSPVAPPCGAPATIIDDQTKTRHRAGRPVRGCDASMPAHRERGPEFLLTRVGSVRKRFSLALTLPRSTGRPFGVGSFRATRLGCSRAIAINIKTTRRGISQCVSQRRPSHFRVSVPFDSHDANENGLTHAQIPFAPGAKAYD